ncbi:ClC family H(+)/Cl(-) exchange transporter [Lentilactobacillus kosonis]|uniref:Voltage-gated chloride channel family protein n=1 Tax=Lentilactobacillus kosonis TaxID=2810561 RepID=A0A401FK35_9LACO|nr:ClC family H(+)/Cl(-) exchange transporter [Lentilactobacillus kosonis]GAY72713.1 voltage-gated chloride channel family protein [Lentilactobacillus kosonis]
MNLVRIHINCNRSQIKLIGSGLIIGVLVGAVVATFRFLIERLQSVFEFIFNQGKTSLMWLGLGIGLFILIAIVNDLLLKSHPEIKGSGIPQVEGQLMGLIDYSFWPALWRKFIGGVLSIGSGLFLGREGPSIQLGSTIGQGVAKWTNQIGINRKVLISSGAAAGLSAAFNAPIASTLFVLEEIYHNFSTNIWLICLTASISADCIATYIFGLKPVLFMSSTSLPIKFFGWVLPLALLLGIFGRIYQLMLLNVDKLYAKIKIIPRSFSGVISLALLIPIMMELPIIIGGGSKLILSLQYLKYSLTSLVVFFIIRLIFSVFTYGSGLPGGIFLPMLCLGALLGAAYGTIMVNLHFIPAIYFPSFVIMGMAGYFSCVSKAPFTAILLITEMVGTLSHLLGLASVALLAYLVVDLLGGKPIYHSLLLKMLGKDENKTESMLFDSIETVFVGSEADGKAIKQLKWPNGSLLIKINRHGDEIIPSGDIILNAGDVLIIRITGNKRQQAIHSIHMLTR